MTFKLTRVAAAVTLLFTLQAGAEEQHPNCADLPGVLQGLDDVASHLGKEKTLENGEKLGQTLEHIVKTLRGIAQSEHNDLFTEAVDEMDATWKEHDRAEFQKALDRVMGNVYRIIRRDCDKP